MPRCPPLAEPAEPSRRDAHGRPDFLDGGDGPRPSRRRDTVRVGQCLSSPSDISWGPDVLVQPDLLVADLAETRSGKWANVQHLLLAVEILSPSSLRADRFTMRTLYQRSGVKTYWVVDADAGLVEMWTPGAVFPVVEEAKLCWQPPAASTALEIPLAELFAG